MSSWGNIRNFDEYEVLSKSPDLSMSVVSSCQNAWLVGFLASLHAKMAINLREPRTSGGHELFVAEACPFLVRDPVQVNHGSFPRNELPFLLVLPFFGVPFVSPSLRFLRFLLGSLNLPRQTQCEGGLQPVACSEDILGARLQAEPAPAKPQARIRLVFGSGRFWGLV